MKKTLSLLLLFVLASPRLAFGESLNDAQSLGGIEAIEVIILEDFTEEQKRDGFSARAYEALVEMRLRQLGIQLFTGPTADAMRSENPYAEGLVGVLAVSLNAMKANENIYVVSVELSLLQAVTNVRYKKSLMEATTWDVEALHVVGKNRVVDFRDSIVGLTEIFANDYLTVNGLEPRSSQKGD